MDGPAGAQLQFGLFPSLPSRSCVWMDGWRWRLSSYNFLCLVGSSWEEADYRPVTSPRGSFPEQVSLGALDWQHFCHLSASRSSVMEAIWWPITCSVVQRMCRSLALVYEEAKEKDVDWRHWRELRLLKKDFLFVIRDATQRWVRKHVSTTS